MLCACASLQVHAALLPSELDCQTMEEAVGSGHHGCLKHICSAEPGSRLEYDDEEDIEMYLAERIEHRSDKSCTALLQLLLSTCTEEQLDPYRDGDHYMWSCLLQSTVSSRRERLNCGTAACLLYWTKRLVTMQKATTWMNSL